MNANPTSIGCIILKREVGKAATSLETNGCSKIGKVNNNNRFKRDSTGDGSHNRKVGSLIKVRAVFSRSSYAEFPVVTFHREGTHSTPPLEGTSKIGKIARFTNNEGHVITIGRENRVGSKGTYNNHPTNNEGRIAIVGR